MTYNQTTLKEFDKAYTSKREDYVLAGVIKVAAGGLIIFSAFKQDQQGAYVGAGLYAVAHAFQDLSKFCLQEIKDDKKSLEAKLKSSEKSEVSKWKN